MKTNIVKLLLFLTLFVTLCALALYANLSQSTDVHDIPTPQTPPDLLALQNNIYTYHVLDRLTLEQKIGQLLIISVPAASDEEILRSMIASIQPGGIILFGPNIQSEAQTQELTATLQKLARELALPPLFIAVDEEGGIVERISFDPVPYSAPELGVLDNETTTRETVRHTAEVLDKLNINVNFAPVADIAFFSDSLMVQRSFSSSSDTVSKQVSWNIDEYGTGNILPTVKHFPGHGRTSVDSHEVLPVIDISKEEWLLSDAIPFITAVQNDVPFIMSGHLLYPQIDQQPSSTSSVWLKDILRNELGYNGIIISDDVKMGAVGIDIPQTALDALTAGNDMIITALDAESLEATRQAILAHYQDPALEDELHEKLLRILMTKYNIAAEMLIIKEL